VRGSSHPHAVIHSVRGAREQHDQRFDCREHTSEMIIMTIQCTRWIADSTETVTVCTCSILARRQSSLGGSTSDRDGGSCMRRACLTCPSCCVAAATGSIESIRFIGLGSDTENTPEIEFCPMLSESHHPTQENTEEKERSTSPETSRVSWSFYGEGGAESVPMDTIISSTVDGLSYRRSLSHSVQVCMITGRVWCCV
jgi:hypothetical protein